MTQCLNNMFVCRISHDDDDDVSFEDLSSGFFPR